MPSKMKTCEDYRTALIDAAAARAEASEPSHELRSHLDACASCRVAYAEEVQLFTAIDTGIQAVANAEVPASLLPLVRTQLNEQPVPSRSWIPASAAMAAAVVLLAAIVLVRGRWRATDEPVLQVSSVTPADLPVVMQSTPSTDAPRELLSAPAKNRFVRADKTTRVPAAKEVSVLIPVGQRQAVNALLKSVRRDKAGPDIFSAEKPEEALQELKVAPLTISPIEVEPLADVGAESPSQKEATKR